MAASPSVSAKTPTGAVARIHSTTTRIVSETARAPRDSVSLSSGSTRVAAKPKITVKITSGRMSPRAAASTGLAGSSPTNQSRKGGRLTSLAALAAATSGIVHPSAPRSR